MSAVWKYFTVEAEGSSTATCNICKTGISRGGKEKAAFNTTNLIRHLKNKHPQTFSEFTAATRAKTLTQPTLKQTLQKKKYVPCLIYTIKVPSCAEQALMHIVSKVKVLYNVCKKFF